MRAIRMGVLTVMLLIASVAVASATIGSDQTPEGARTAVVADLVKRFGPLPPRSLVQCPKEEIFELVEGEGVQALCRYSFTEREQTTTRAGSYTVSGPHTAPAEPKSSYSIKYEQRLRTCPRPPIIRQANGVTMRSIRFEAAGPFCRSFLPGDTAYSATGVYPRVRKRFAYYEHGTNTAGFADFAGYPCTSRARRRDGGLRYDLRCANGVGDRYQYSFVVYRRAVTPPKPQPAPRPKPQPTQPNYEGRTCAEIGRSYRVTPGTDREHDADGDGVACESEG